MAQYSMFFNRSGSIAPLSRNTAKALPRVARAPFGAAYAGAGSLTDTNPVREQDTLHALQMRQLLDTRSPAVTAKAPAALFNLFK